MPKPSADAEPTLIGCPACSGVSSLVPDGSRTHAHLVCTVGHQFSLPSVLEAKESELEKSLWAAISQLEHIDMAAQLLFDQIDRHALSLNGSDLRARAEQARQQGQLIRRIIEETRVPDLSPSE